MAAEEVTILLKCLMCLRYCLILASAQLLNKNLLHKFGVYCFTCWAKQAIPGGPNHQLSGGPNHPSLVVQTTIPLVGHSSIPLVVQSPIPLAGHSSVPLVVHSSLHWWSLSQIPCGPNHWNKVEHPETKSHLRGVDTNVTGVEKQTARKMCSARCATVTLKMRQHFGREK